MEVLALSQIVCLHCEVFGLVKRHLFAIAVLRAAL